MFDIGWSELALAATVAFVVFGPRELPHVLRTLGSLTRSVRNMARDFRAGLDAAVDFDDLRADAHKMLDMDLAGDDAGGQGPKEGSPASPRTAQRKPGAELKSKPAKKQIKKRGA